MFARLKQCLVWLSDTKGPEKIAKCASMFQGLSVQSSLVMSALAAIYASLRLGILSPLIKEIVHGGIQTWDPWHAKRE